MAGRSRLGRSTPILTISSRTDPKDVLSRAKRGRELPSGTSPAPSRGMRILQTSALCFWATLTACGGLSVFEEANGDGSGSISSGTVAADVVRYTNDERVK